MTLDWLKILYYLDKVAIPLRYIGLRRLTRAVRERLRGAISDALQIQWEGLVITGAIEHRNYLYSLREGKRETAGARLLYRLVPKDGVVIDVGAFIGVYTFWLEN